MPDSYKTLLLGIGLFLVTLLISASVHVVPLLVFEVPVPQPPDNIPPISQLFILCVPYVLAIIFLVFVMGPSYPTHSIGFYILFLLTFMACREELIRSPLMALIAENSLTGPGFIQSLPMYITYLIFGLAVCTLHRYMATIKNYIKATIISISTIIILALFIPLLSDTVSDYFVKLSSDYNADVASYEPYGPNVLIMAYMTFIPKTIAYFIVWHFFMLSSIARVWTSRIVYTLGMLFCTTGSLLLMLPYTADKPAFLYSSSQFLLEDVSFAILTMLFYPWTNRLLKLKLVEP